MFDFFKWLVNPNYINSNVFGLLTVVFSGLVSWLISALYFRKGNRNALRLNIIFPIKNILKEPRSWKNYKGLDELSKSYDAKYLTRHEQTLLSQLLSAYKVVCAYNYSYVCAESLFSYFKYKLKQNGIDTQPVPIFIDDEIVDYEEPIDLFYLRDDLARVIENCPSEYEDDALVEEVKSLFKAYCKEFFTDKEIVFFNDSTFDEVLKKARIRHEWDEKLANYKEAEKQLFQVRIFKK
ncbi:MAG: hypothetical protein IKU25_07495 [Clostridia bacterium]|nr:hypothetical protein [Clostridia bacterium]